MKMKKMIYMGALALIAAGGIFWSCQKDEFETNPENGLMLKSAYTYPVGGCESVCIEPGSEDYWIKTYTKDYDTDPVTSVTINVYNTETDLKYDVTSTAGIKYLEIDGDVLVDIAQNDNSSNSNFTVSKSYSLGTFGIDWNPCDNIANNIIIRRNQKNPEGNLEKELIFDTSYDLIGICQPEEEGCTESFTYKDNEDGTLTFTYQPADDMTDVNVVFTFPQVENITFLSGYEYEIFKRPGNGNAQNMQAKLSFTSCEKYTWKVQLVDCTAASTSANGWTEFTVGGISKKTSSTPNFTYKCPVSEE